MQSEWLQAPFSVTDVMAAVLLTLAALHLALRLRDQERGLGAIAAAMALLAVFVFFNERSLPSDPFWLTPGWWFSSFTLAFACLGVGVVDYLKLEPPWRARVLLALLAPLIVASVIACGVNWGWWRFSRPLFVFIVTSPFIGLAALGAWAARREPGVGHGYIGLAFLMLPALSLFLAWVGSPRAAVRYWGVVPLIVVGLTLLTVPVVRKRRELEAEVARRSQAEQALASLNASLEARVAERTVELQDVIAGLESFNRSVSHDLRGPLGGIGGLITLTTAAIERDDRAGARRALHAMAWQVDASSRLVEELLIFARSNHSALETAELDLGALAQEALTTALMARAPNAQLTTLAQGAAPPNGVAPPARVEIGLLPTIKGDATLLRSAFVNLLGNALKFTSGQADATVRVEGRREPDGQVTITVSDNGVGFAPEAAGALFQPFTRLHGGRFAGTGIGLAIVRRVVERHGGRVWAEGRPGHGATFGFTLPG
jgi:signal transduction histidine kinase